MDTLNQAPVGSGAGNLALDRARGVAGGQPAPPAPGGQPTPAPGFPGSAPGAPGLPGGLQIPQMLVPKITVIGGTRVFDVIPPYELLDDATERQVAESEKDNYFDDGTHGDIEANDGKYTSVKESRDAYLSQSNQRIKEQLIQALIVADAMNPLQFYGYTLMSTERMEAASRNRAWKLVPNPNGPGSLLKETLIDKPVVVPKYREKEAEKDVRVKDDWSNRFLQEYRKDKDSLSSQFYALYIPMPPVPPKVAPPGNWHPYAATTSAEALNRPSPATPRGRGQPMGIDEYAAGGASHGYYNASGQR
jgi:hypothetical protein